MPHFLLAPIVRLQSLTFKITASISLVFKSLKPPASFTLSVQPTDTVSAIKAQLAAQPKAPPADAQRLLLKGKALADGKLLKEYNVKEGDTINLMLKPGFDWNPNAPPTTKNTDIEMSDASAPKPFGGVKLDPNAKPGGDKKRHQRVPSVVLSPSPSSESPGAVEKDILLTLDADVGPVTNAETLSTYHETVSNPLFWERLYAFLKYVIVRLRASVLSLIESSVGTSSRPRLTFTRHLRTSFVQRRARLQHLRLQRFVTMSA